MTEPVAVNSVPDGASCELTRGGAIIAHVDTPGTIYVERSREHIQVVCKKEGCQPSTATIESGTEGWVLGNLLFGGLIGGAVDAASGASNDYEDQITVPLSC